MQRRYDIILCDSDDTLLDFGTACRQALLGALSALGVPASGERAYELFRPLTDIMWQRLERGEITREQLFFEREREYARLLGTRFEPGAFNEQYRHHLRLTKCVIPGAVEFLRELAPLGIKPYIITNADFYCASERLKPLRPYVFGEFISESMGCAKPSERFFSAVHAAIGEPDKSRVLVFGDSETSDICGARAFGYDSCLFDRSGKRETAAEYCVRSYAELVDNVLCSG